MMPGTSFPGTDCPHTCLGQRGPPSRVSVGGWVGTAGELVGSSVGRPPEQ